MRKETRNMREDCSLLRIAGYPLDVCKWMKDEENSVDAFNIDWHEQPHDLWSVDLADVDEKIEKYKLQKDFQDNNHHNPIDWLKDDIKRCSKDFSVQVTDVAKRMKYLEQLQSAIKKITSVTEAGTQTLKYITEEDGVSIFDDTFGKMEKKKLDNLSTNLALTQTRLKTWNDALSTITSFYDDLELAADEVHKDTDACVPEFLEDIDEFKSGISLFKTAYDGIEDAKKSELTMVYSVQKWMSTYLR